jgi:hypothetical protein
MRALLLLFIVGLPLLVLLAWALMPHRRPADDQDVTDRSVTPPPPGRR